MTKVSDENNHHVVNLGEQTFCLLSSSSLPSRGIFFSFIFSLRGNGKKRILHAGQAQLEE